MALSTSFSNFFSFPSPPTKSPQRPSQLHLLSPFPSQQNRNNKFIPLVLTRNETSSSSSSSSSPEPPEDMSSSFSTSNPVHLGSVYNVQVVVEDDEPEERLLNRFRREVMRAGVIQETKRRRYFENTQDEKKRRVRDAAKRNRRNRFPWRPMGAGGKSPRGQYYNNYGQDDPKPKEADDDNWDLPEEDVLNF